MIHACYHTIACTSIGLLFLFLGRGILTQGQRVLITKYSHQWCTAVLGSLPLRSLMECAPQCNSRAHACFRGVLCSVRAMLDQQFQEGLSKWTKSSFSRL